MTTFAVFKISSKPADGQAISLNVKHLTAYKNRFTVSVINERAQTLTLSSDSWVFRNGAVVIPSETLEKNPAYTGGEEITFRVSSVLPANLDDVNLPETFTKQDLEDEFLKRDLQDLYSGQVRVWNVGDE